MKKIILGLKKFFYYYFDLFELRGNSAIKSSKEILSKREMYFEESPVVFGIAEEAWGLHKYYIQACIDNKISYKTIDLFSYDWFNQLNSLHIDALICRPSVQYDPWKNMFDNRLSLIQKNTSIKILPDTLGLWLWESKLRTCEWLKVCNIPSPQTNIFYSQKELNEYLNTSKFPLVVKSSSGSGASGVIIVHNKNNLLRIAKKYFKKGIRSYRKHRLDKEHGYIIIQEYLDNVKEWRIIRIGDFYFGFEKIKSGEFHSGSQSFGYGFPPVECLNLVKSITDKYDIKYVDIDIFVTKENRFLVNEIQPYFGQKDDRELLQVNGKSGRISFVNNSWEFEEGEFCKNNLCNLRVQEFLKGIK